MIGGLLYWLNHILVPTIRRFTCASYTQLIWNSLINNQYCLYYSTVSCHSSFYEIYWDILNVNLNFKIEQMSLIEIIWGNVCFNLKRKFGRHFSALFFFFVRSDIFFFFPEFIPRTYSCKCFWIYRAHLSQLKRLSLYAVEQPLKLYVFCSIGVVIITIICHVQRLFYITFVGRPIKKEYKSS